MCMCGWIIEKSLNGEPDTTYQFNKERRNK